MSYSPEAHLPESHLPDRRTKVLHNNVYTKFKILTNSQKYQLFKLLKKHEVTFCDFQCFHNVINHFKFQQYNNPRKSLIINIKVIYMPFNDLKGNIFYSMKNLHLHNVSIHRKL